MKIRTAIFVVYVVASACGFVVLMAFILREVRPRYVESMRRTLNDTAVLVADMVESELDRRAGAGESTDPKVAWSEAFGVFAGRGGLLRVFLTDRAHAFDDGESYDSRAEIRGYFRRDDDTAANATLVEGELRVTAPVIHAGSVVAYVGVGRPLASVTDAIWAARVKLVIGSGLIAVIMVGAGWWISSRLSHSIERLTEYAVRVRDGKDGTPPQSRATEIAALVTAFEEMRRSLEGKNYIERYTQALTHEIKAPLSAIRGAVELIDEGMDPAEQARFLKNIRSETARIQHIIDQLLQLSSIEARHGKIDATRLDLRSATAAVVNEMKGFAEARGVTLDLHSPEEPAEVRGEGLLLSLAITNLVQNAIEFSPDQGRVAVALERTGRLVRLIVEDEGPGIPDYARDRVFERFFSLPRPATGRKSTGLGLSLVHEVAALHGGGVTLANREPGPGARACLEIPAVG